MNIVFCSFTYRCLMNYAPLLHEIERQGGTVELVLFPRLCDPDHRGLDDVPFSVRSRYPIGREGELLAGNIQAIVDDIRSPDALLLGTCNLGPEREIGGMTGARHVVGLQHGFYQDWEDYERNPSIPTLGVFGRKFGDAVRKPTVVLGLPKLDLVPHVGPNERGVIVYAGQYSNYPDALKATLTDLQAMSGRNVVVRPHPEGRAHLDMLREDFEFLDPEEPLVACMQRAAFMVTTGSTVVLEALVADVPIVVIPDCHGRLYEPAGIVADAISADAVMAVLDTMNDRLTSKMQFLRDYTGSACRDRTTRAYSALSNLIEAPNHRQAP